MRVLLLHGNNVDDIFLVVGGAAYVAFMFVASRIRQERKKRRRARRKAERAAHEDLAARHEPDTQPLPANGKGMH